MTAHINILCVDDKPENLLALEAILDDLNVTFIAATSGNEALDCLLKVEVALILMDVMMPGMDGYETAELIRGSNRTRQIPIIFISAINTEQEHIFRGYTSGAVDYLAKPIVPEILRSKVAIFIELFQQRRILRERAHQLQLANEHISRQKEALAVSEVRFRSAFEQSFQFMAILDRDGRILELNDLAKKLCGNVAGGVKGQLLWEVCWVGQEEENKKLKEVVEKAAAGERLSDEAQFTDIDGNVRYLFRAVSPVKNDSGDVVCITVQGHDITQRVKAEQEKRNLELLLQQAQKMEALGVLAGGIAHDFNNVLSVIIGNNELAQRDTGSTAAQQHHYNRIHTAAIKAKDLVSQILSFSRNAEIEKVALQPADIVIESVKLLRSFIPATIEIEHKVDASCGTILADPTQFHQIIMNLCTNAFHAMERQGGVLTIGLRQVHLDSAELTKKRDIAPGPYCHLMVGDTGEGIQDTHIDRIYEPYFTTKEEGRGTGMGLSIVHGIVKSHDGSIQVESAVGVGTIFHVYIPIAGEVHPENKINQSGLSCGNEHILLVDDEPLLLEMVKNMLELAGYTVTAMGDSIEALHHFCKNPDSFDLVITDQTMPGMVGTDLARKILRIQPEMPIILCTGYSPDITHESVTEFGIKELALKPLAIDQLTRIVRQTLDRQ